MHEPERLLRAVAGEPMILYDFLRLRMGLTRKQISQLKYRQPGILVNGEKQYVTWKLQPGDVVEAALEGRASGGREIHLNPAPVEILYEDEDLIAVNKPAGVATHPAGMHQDDTLVNMLMFYFHEKGESLRVRPAGRLDISTSGVILFSKNQTAAGRLVRQKERRILRKEYTAVVSGRMEQTQGEIRLPIRRDPENVCRVIISEEGKPALTRWRVMTPEELAGVREAEQPENPAGSREPAGGFSFLRVAIETGRMHQIRIHMSAAGHPLLGDVMYGGPGEEICRAALHASCMWLRHPFTDEPIRIEAPLPEDMQKLLRHLC